MKDPSSLSRRKQHPSSKKLKLVCSFNGRFRRRSPDGKLRYTGGETRIISVDPTRLTYSMLRSTISELLRVEKPEFSLKYQLPGSDDIDNSPLVLIASDDDVLCMVEEFECVESYGKPSRLWLFVCYDGCSDYVDDDDDDKDDGSFADVDNDDDDNLGGCGFRREKVVGSMRGKGFLVRHGVNGRRVSDNCLRKLVLKQRLLAKQQDFEVKKYDDHPLVDLGPETLDAKTGDVVNSSGVDSERIVQCYDQLPSDRNPGGFVPTPLPLSFKEKDQSMMSSMVNCAQRMASSSAIKQELGFSGRVPLQYLNRENILPFSQDLNSLNCHLVCENQVVGNPSRQKSFHRGQGVLGHHCNIGIHQFSSNGMRNQRVVCPSYSRNHHVVKLDVKTSVAARCYPGLGACSSTSKQGHAPMRVNHPNLPKPLCGQDEYKSAEMGRLISPDWNDRAFACSLQPNRADIKKHAKECQSVGVDSPQVMEDLLIDFGDESSGDNKHDVSYERVSETTIKKEETCCHDPNLCEILLGSQNVEQAPGIMSNAANHNGVLVNVEEISQLTSDYLHGCHPMPDGDASLVDVSSYNSSLADSHASSEILDELKMAHLKLLDPIVEAKPVADTKASNGNVLQSINDTMMKASEEEMQDHSHATPSINDNVDTGRSHKHSGELNGFPSNLAAFYTHLATRELQKISDSDLEYIKELGSGNYGTVYYGKWKGSDVAIKKIKPNCFTGDAKEDDRLVADFWKEAHMLGQLHHPNIVSFYGVVSDGPVTNLATVTEYMINGSLKQVLQKKDRTIDRRKRLIIAMDAAFGMEYLHEKNIVHFDLKSHNFLVNMRDPQRPVCKIGDLGLSKIKQRTLISGGVRGTIPWMAPELLSTTTNLVTEKVDVYSFGIVMWELLTGEEPYANMRSQEILAGIIKGTLRPEIPSWCDPGWRSLMERCWSSDPKSRPSFSEVAKELRAMSSAMNIK